MRTLRLATLCPEEMPKKNQLSSFLYCRFVNRKLKIALLKQGRKLKGINVYINKHLIKHNADIAKPARYLKKQKKIQHTWTSNCKIFIKLNGTPEEAKVLMVKTINDLDKYQSSTWAGLDCNVTNT